MGADPITSPVTVHTPAGPSPARWTWSPRWPITVRLVVDLPRGGYDVLSFGRVQLYRLLNSGPPPNPPVYPESTAWMDAVAGRRVLRCELTPHIDRDRPGVKRHVRVLRLWTPWLRAAQFLSRTFTALPACPYRGWCPQGCDESRITQEALLGELLTEEPTT